MYHLHNIQKLRILLMHYIDVCHVLQLNTDYFPEQHQVIGLCNGDSMFCIRQRWNFYI